MSQEWREQQAWLKLHPVVAPAVPTPTKPGIDVTAISTPAPSVITPPTPASESMELYRQSLKVPIGTRSHVYIGPLDISYDERGYLQWLASVRGGVESVLTPLEGLVEGEQPFEVMPGETSFTWRDVAKSDIAEDKKFWAQVAGGTVEAAGTYALMRGVGVVAGIPVGLVGSTVARIPYVGTKAWEAGTALATWGASPEGKFVLGAMLVIPEGFRLASIEKKYDWQTAVAQGAIDVGGIFGFGQGLSYGLNLGASIPEHIIRKVKGGITLKASEVTQESVLAGKERFTTFKGEGDELGEYPTVQLRETARSFKIVSERYTPPIIEMPEGLITGYSATDFGEIATSLSKGGVPEGGLMWYAPAVSKPFLRIGSSAYSIQPGLPNIFGRPTIVQAGFTDVLKTNLGKSSEALVKLAEKYVGTGIALMPVEQALEAQAVIGGGTILKQFGGNVWVDFGWGILVPLRQVLPGITAASLGIAGETFTVKGLLNALNNPTPTTYVNVVALSLALGSPVTGAPSSVSLSPTAAAGYVDMVETGELFGSQLKSSMSVLDDVTASKVMDYADSSYREDIYDSMTSSQRSYYDSGKPSEPYEPEPYEPYEPEPPEPVPPEPGVGRGRRKLEAKRRKVEDTTEKTLKYLVKFEYHKGADRVTVEAKGFESALDKALASTTRRETAERTTIRRV